MRLAPLPLAIMFALVNSPSAFANDDESQEPPKMMEHIVVIGEAMEQPLTVVADPKQIRQPLPAHDAADYLKSLAGFSVIRKGGASSDLVFRGMAASRINILADGETLLGGCGNRMDPPTAYIAPQSYDRMVVLKGPHDVTNGPGSSAATVRFERAWQYYPDYTQQTFVSATTAQYGRFDSNADVLWGNSSGFIRLNGTAATSDDYKDGNGNRIHSAYERWSTQATVGYTPNADSIFSVSIGMSDGEAAYADRAMDGTKFARESVGLRYSQRNISPLIAELNAQLYYNYIDHIMDNFSLREFTPSMMMQQPTVSNPDRRTRGARVSVVLEPESLQRWEIGLDAQQNDHRIRRTMNQNMMPYQDMSFSKDADFEQLGAFAELRLPPSQNGYAAGEWIMGARVDYWQARDLRTNISQHNMMHPNPTANMQRSESLYSGFIRYEFATDLGSFYVGPGYVERFPDYWELVGANRAGADSRSAFLTAAEKTLQIDAGWIAQNGAWNHSLALFAAQIDDYILVDNQVVLAPSAPAVVGVRNISARNFGGELEVGYQLTSAWRADAALAYTRGTNRTDGIALAQQAPLEASFSIRYSADEWAANALLRTVAAQNRVAVGQGNIVGTDLGATPGFAALSISAERRLTPQLRLYVGVDNLLDKAYAEHLSRSGVAVSGYLPSSRVMEPGRVAWLSIQWRG